MEKLELPKNKTNREVLNEEYFAKAAPAVYEAISNAYREGYHTGWMRAAKFYIEKYRTDEVEENAESAEMYSGTRKTGTIPHDDYVETVK